MDLLLSQAKEAIAEIFSDTSVTPEQTLERLTDLREEVEIRIAALEEDFDRKETDGL